MRAIAVTSCLFCLSLLGGEGGVLAAQETASAPQVRQQNGIAYMSGGVGVDEVASMRRMAEQFNVRMRFVDSADGSYLSDVSVTLFNARREIILAVLSEGPFLYLKLAPANYRAVIRYGKTLDCRSIQVKPGPRSINMLVRLPAQQDEEKLIAGTRDRSSGCARQPACCGGGRR